MTISEYAQVIAIIGGFTGAGQYYVHSEFVGKTDPPPYDHVYVLIAAQNLKLLYAAEDELARLMDKVKNGSATEADRLRIATLRERILHLKE